MRSILHRITATALLLLTAGMVTSPSIACGFDGILGDGFSAEHPRSIAVAFAISDAVAAGIVDKTAVTPIVPGSSGYWRAVGRISALHRLFAAASIADGDAPAISLLFIDSKLWARFSPEPQGYALQVHAPGASPGDVVIVTSEAILAAVLDGTMAAKRALDLGLIAIDGEPNRTAATRDLLVSAADRVKGVAVTGAPATLVRAFGPAH
ncbi:hypothetical protein V5F34_15655 [Xanthobacter autotrophicus]|uniref:hypothetical protein n=1 Tax=Xanthobacter autotrophicus TaxID=280 RepID=UPI003727FF70